MITGFIDCKNPLVSKYNKNIKLIMLKNIETKRYNNYNFNPN